MKKLLIITTSFSPENAIGSIRLSKLVKYLVRMNYEITVISPTLHEATKIDSSLESEELNKITRIQIPQSKLFNRFFLKKRNQVISSNSASELIKDQKNHNILNKLKTETYRLIQFIYTIIRNKDWKKQVVKYVNNNYKKGDFDVAFSSYPSLGGPWSLIYVKKKGIAKKIVIDFRDPVNYEINSNFYKTFFNTLIQKKIISKADKVTYISKGIAKKFGKVEPEKLVLLPNGYDSEDLPSINNLSPVEKKFTLSYVGSLYGGERDLSIVFKALHELISNNDINEENLQIIYAGKEFQVLYNQAKKYGVESLLINKGFITRQEAIEVQFNSDLVMISSWNTEKDQGILSGKVFECFLTRKPVLAVINGTKPKSELAEMIKDVNGGISIEEASPEFEIEYENMKKTLAKMYKDKIQNNKTTQYYNSLVENYDYKNISNKLSKLFETLTS